MWEGTEHISALIRDTIDHGEDAGNKLTECERQWRFEVNVQGRPRVLFQHFSGLLWGLDLPAIRFRSFLVPAQFGLVSPLLLVSR